MIIDLQRRLAEAGRIRIGQQVPTGGKDRNGRDKTRPEKLTTFRLTSPDRLRIQHAAHLYGGQPTEWQAPAGPQWEVVTEADALNVIVPPSDMAFSQHYELWSGGGCQRRCDGRIESISDGPCPCDPDARECDIHTRLSVMLRDLPGLGVWRIDTSGYYAAVELQGAVEVVQLAAGRGQMLPARLRLEQRVVKRPGQGVRRFAVPVLDIEVSPAQLLGGGDGAPLAIGNGDEVSARRQIDAAAPLTPVPENVPIAPVRSIADQAAAVNEATPKPKRRNAAQPVPATGIKPRTAAEAARPTEPTTEADASIDGEANADAVAQMSGTGVTRAQQNLLHAQLGELGLGDRESKLTTVGILVGHTLTSSNDLTKAEATRVIDTFKHCQQSDDPRRALDAVLASAQDDEQQAEGGDA